MSATTNQPYDPFEAADNPEIRNKTYFGHVTVDAHAVVLQRGSRPLNFDPYQHSIEDRRTQVKVSIQPLAGSKYMDPINRDMLVESNEYAKIFHPSLKAIGVKPRDLSGKYVRAEMIPTREYIKADGTPGMATTPKIVAVYATEPECRAAQDALFGRHEATETAPVQATNTPSQPAQPPSNGLDAKSQDAILNALWGQSNKNTTTFETLFKAIPQLRDLTLDSEPVKRVMGVF